jgi:hypothetical protein
VHPMNNLRKITLSSARAAETFVRSSNLESKGYSAKWDGWTIVTFSAHPGGMYHPRGVFDRDSGLWGYSHRHPVTSVGTWVVKVPTSNGQGR